MQLCIVCQKLGRQPTAAVKDIVYPNGPSIPVCDEHARTVLIMLTLMGLRP